MRCGNLSNTVISCIPKSIKASAYVLEGEGFHWCGFDTWDVSPFV
jgi:hypothetical protein